MHTPEWIVLAVVVVGVIIALFGWDRYRGNGGENSGAQATNEVFVDPDTGTRTRVWYNPATGEREYRAE